MNQAFMPGTRGVVARTLTLELARVTERAAIAAAALRGQGNEKAADQAAVDAMRAELNALPIDGTVVIGEGERDQAPMLFIGERLGSGGGPRVDLAVDPLEGTTLCAKDMPDNIAALARAKGVPPSQIVAIVLDRPRHADLVAAIRATGAGVRLISDGDIAAIIFTNSPAETGVDIYLGIGAAPEGVIAAGALRCIGGQMQGRLILDTPEKRRRAQDMGIGDPNRKYELADLARGDVIVAATGVTDGALLRGVRFKPGVIETETLVYRSATGTVRRILGEHRRTEGDAG